jgi:hypothetical protein
MKRKFCTRSAKEIPAGLIKLKTLIRPVVSYGVEVWTLTKKEEQTMLIFDWKIFRRMYVLKYENGKWKSRTNRELEEMSKGENIVNQSHYRPGQAQRVPGS